MGDYGTSKYESIHPPSVVLIQSNDSLCPAEYLHEFPDSPLSSAPNSPRSLHRSFSPSGKLPDEGDHDDDSDRGKKNVNASLFVPAIVRMESQHQLPIDEQLQDDEIRLLNQQQKRLEQQGDIFIKSEDDSGSRTHRFLKTPIVAVPGTQNWVVGPPTRCSTPKSIKTAQTPDTAPFDERYTPTAIPPFHQHLAASPMGTPVITAPNSTGLSWTVSQTSHDRAMVHLHSHLQHKMHNNQSGALTALNLPPLPPKMVRTTPTTTPQPGQPRQIILLDDPDSNPPPLILLNRGEGTIIPAIPSSIRNRRHSADVSPLSMPTVILAAADDSVPRSCSSLPATSPLPVWATPTSNRQELGLRGPMMFSAIPPQNLEEGDRAMRQNTMKASTSSVATPPYAAQRNLVDLLPMSSPGGRSAPANTMESWFYDSMSSSWQLKQGQQLQASPSNPNNSSGYLPFEDEFPLDQESPPAQARVHNSADGRGIRPLSGSPPPRQDEDEELPAIRPIRTQESRKRVGLTSYQLTASPAGRQVQSQREQPFLSSQQSMTPPLPYRGLDDSQISWSPAQILSTPTPNSRRLQHQILENDNLDHQEDEHIPDDERRHSPHVNQRMASTGSQLSRAQLEGLSMDDQVPIGYDRRAVRQVRDSPAALSKVPNLADSSPSHMDDKVGRAAVAEKSTTTEPYRMDVLGDRPSSSGGSSYDDALVLWNSNTMTSAGGNSFSEGGDESAIEFVESTGLSRMVQAVHAGLDQGLIAVSSVSPYRVTDASPSGSLSAATTQTKLQREDDSPVQNQAKTPPLNVYGPSVVEWDVAGQEQRHDMKTDKSFHEPGAHDDGRGGSSASQLATPKTHHVATRSEKDDKTLSASSLLSLPRACQESPQGGWWLEKEMAKRMEQRNAGTVPISVAEQIAHGMEGSVNVPIDVSSVSEPPALRRVKPTTIDDKLSPVSSREGSTASRRSLHITASSQIRNQSKDDRGWDPDLSGSGSLNDDDLTMSAGSFSQNLDDAVRAFDEETLPDLRSLSPRQSQHESISRPRQDPEPIANGLPIHIGAIDNDIGIPKGDVLISLLSEHPNVTWTTRVNEAIWRGRKMRQDSETKSPKERGGKKVINIPSAGRTSVQVDVDDARVVGGIDGVGTTQNAAINHLKYNDFEDALALYEDILMSYHRFFDLRPSKTSKNKYLGSVLHNIGLIEMLRGEFEKGLVYFDKAIQSRSSYLGKGHPDSLVSLVRKATCLIALEDCSKAEIALEEASVICRETVRTMADQRQVAEILNNLGCLFYLAGHAKRATKFFHEAFEAQRLLGDHSLYTGSKFSCSSACLHISVIVGNLGFLDLAANDIPNSIALFETAARDQILLLRDAYVTLTTTMDYLVIANLLGGEKDKALLLLRRILHLQLDAFGPNDARCLTTGNKIELIESHDDLPVEGFENLQAALARMSAPSKGKKPRFIPRFMRRKGKRAGKSY